MIGLLFLSVLTTHAWTASSQQEATVSGIDILLNALNSSSFLLITGIFVALTVCEDYEQQTIKNIYARGYSRKQVYGSKLLLTWVSTTVMFLLVLLAAIVFGAAYFELRIPDPAAVVRILGVQYVVCMANLCLSFLVSSALRKNGSAIAAVIVAPMLINMLLGMLDSFFKPEHGSATGIWLSSFLGDLSMQTVSTERLTVCLIASLLYILLFALLGARFSKQTEL